jgi:hypothetical protein
MRCTVRRVKMLMLKVGLETAAEENLAIVTSLLLAQIPDRCFAESLDILPSHH